jgi:hypothetical protein
MVPHVFNPSLDVSSAVFAVQTAGCQQPPERTALGSRAIFCCPSSLPAAPGAYSGAGSSCEAAMVAYAHQLADEPEVGNLQVGGSRAPEGERNDAARVLNHGTYLKECGVPPSTTVMLCAAVRGGIAEGVSVTTMPDDPARAACIADTVRRLHMTQTGRKMDLATTVFESGAALPAALPKVDSDFDRNAALATLTASALAAEKCKPPNGTGRIVVVFAPETGLVKSAVVETFSTADRQYGAGFHDTEAGRCVERAFASARVPPFQGAPVTVHKTFALR